MKKGNSAFYAGEIACEVKNDMNVTKKSLVTFS